MKKIGGSYLRRLYLISKREMGHLVSRPLYVFSMIIAPIFIYVFFTTLMGEGLPTNLPVGVVDLDNTISTRKIVRTLDSFEQTEIVGEYANFAQARKAMQQGKIYAFYYIPKGTTVKILANRRPKISFYTNNSLLIAGSLLYRDLRTASVLAGAYVQLETLKAHGYTEAQGTTWAQPIVINMKPLNNPWLNYSVYLNNTIVPGVLMIFIFMITVYTIGDEWKNDTVGEWMRLAGGNIVTALVGKLLPQTIIFFLTTALYDAYFFGFLHYPCNGGALPMLLAAFLMVLASQAFGIFLIGMIPNLRLALCGCSLWGVVSFSISGFSFPVMAMHPTLQALSVLFPLRHYFLIYVNSALDGYPMIYAWPSYIALILFCLLPFAVLKRLHTAVCYFKYQP